ncbi:hypothetical protein GCM10011514_51780 [Emticicia aquatilis]|uniref:Uncharacterized protein n=1 Tax=Emticicia aquatilis TaxID=1537369 RepID=A0A917DXN4_9BACT|nr:DUF5694 domain-containing protein [Emticicia aquatilis]GGD81339.1 hypothetical protein GCM10011514_51780 [Emticicia aquatilis]
MKKLLLLFLILLPTFSLSAQTKPTPKKIQIVLLGTFHLNQSLDSNSRLHSDLFSKKRQKEVDEIVNSLANFNPDKIYVENTPDRQPYWDSLYFNYQKGIEPSNRKVNANEIVQFGFKTAKKLNLKGVKCVDFQPADYDSPNFKTEYALEKTIKNLFDQMGAYNDSVRTNDEFLSKGYPFKRPKQDSLLQKTTLAEYILAQNTPESAAYFTYSDWSWYYGLGRKDEYVGVDVIANFHYSRNARIFANILRDVEYKKDNRYVLIYGSSHIPFLKHLFETYPYFEVIALENVLKTTK